MNYGFIGAGNMATAMIKGLIYQVLIAKYLCFLSTQCS